MAKIYGKSDKDLSAEKLLYKLTEGKDVQYYMLHPRKALNARPCQLPDSLTVQALLADNTVITVRQLRTGATPQKV